jgi:hypothetical protein
MNYRKLGLKALGLCLLSALSAMAFAAVAAGHVYVNLTLLTETVQIRESAKNTTHTLLTTFGAGETPLTKTCTAILIHDGLLFTNGGGLAELLFSSCSTSISGLVKANCKPLEPIVVKVKTSLVHHNGDTYILFSPHTGTIFTTLHLGELCAAGEEVELTGSFTTECGSLLGSPTALWHHEDCNVHKVTQTIQPASAALFPSHKLSFGSKVMTLDGHLGLVTTGPHEGGSWAADVL